MSCRVEFLCHDINVHVPHHVSSKIPWYNLRAATDSLRANWGQVRPLPPRHEQFVGCSALPVAQGHRMSCLPT